MKNVTITCDCGKCKANGENGVGGWFVLSQEKPNARSNSVKLEREFHFAFLSCIETWLARALPAAASLEEAVRENGTTVRGTYESKKVPGIYV